jgi:hypothetical protein
MTVLWEELERYFEGNPGAMVREQHGPADNPSIVFTARKPIPARIPLLIGDVLQNLRSTLDYLVWELVVAAKNHPAKKHQFPVCLTANAFDDALNRGRLDGIDQVAVDIIKGLQPFHFSDEGVEHSAIAVLDELVNINKHRTILTTILNTTRITNFQIIENAGATYAIGTPSGENLPRRFVLPIGEEPNTQIGAFMQIDEGYAKGEEVSSLVNRLFRVVSQNVLPLFEEFFV